MLPIKGSSERRTTSLLLKGGVTKVTTINIPKAIDPFTVECIWHEDGRWKTPSKHHRLCLHDSYTVEKNCQAYWCSTRTRIGHAARHIATFLCLCFDFIWTKVLLLADFLWHLVYFFFSQLFKYQVWLLLYFPFVTCHFWLQLAHEYFSINDFSSNDQCFNSSLVRCFGIILEYFWIVLLQLLKSVHNRKRQHPIWDDTWKVNFIQLVLEALWCSEYSWG